MKLRLLLALGCAFTIAPLSAMAENTKCTPTLHNDIAIKDDTVISRSEHGEFIIEKDGSLFMTVHPVKLSEEQKASLKIYNQTVRDDLPYMGQGLLEEIQTSWLALDEVLENELSSFDDLDDDILVTNETDTSDEFEPS